MKISIGTNVKKGPWGGGNLFAINLTKYLEEKGHIVVSDLNDPDIDIVLLTEPRKTSESSAFTHIDVNNYLNFVNDKSIVVHRINECDERKGTTFVNDYLVNVNKSANYTVFVSSWLEELFEYEGLTQENKKVILAGANKEIFNSKGYVPWDRKTKLKIVTHHWGANWNKGFEIYSKLDDLLSQNFWKDKVEFTYIGNLPKNYFFKNSQHILPLSGLELANKLKESHIYITASLNEPSGNHHIEAAQCSLPLLFIDSGGIPEYCNDYGLIFNSDDFETKLLEMYENYDFYFKKIIEYPFNSEKMCQEYLDLFENLIKHRKNTISSRNIKNLEVSNEFLYKLKKLKFIKKMNIF
tara:strand:- start:1195 stop:2253 length:1059 start_codon:yes stop_codon:yes gene_type:complete